MGIIQEVTHADYTSEVLQSDVPGLVNFWAVWCPPCRMIAPIVDELSTEYAGRMKFAKLNTDDSPKTPGGPGIMSIPKLIFYKGEVEVERLVGARPKGDLKKAIERTLVAGPTK